MPMAADEIAALIRATLPDAQVEITDLAGDDDHYAASVKSAHFAGKTRLQQHRMVYQALGDRMGEQLHALVLQTGLPD